MLDLKINDFCGKGGDFSPRIHEKGDFFNQSYSIVSQMLTVYHLNWKKKTVSLFQEEV